MTDIYLLRHGETEWNRLGNRYCGITDIPLSDIGRSQARLVSDYLKNVPFDMIYSSPLKRAYETANLVIGKNNLPIYQDDRLREIDFGKWEGKTKDQIIIEDLNTWRQWDNDPTNVNAGQTGETAKEVYMRSKDFFDELGQKHSDKTILVVGHNTLNRLFIIGSLGSPFRAYRSIKQQNTAITILQLKDEIEIIQLNIHEHLKKNEKGEIFDELTNKRTIVKRTDL